MRIIEKTMTDRQQHEITGIHRLPLYGALAVVLFALVVVAGALVTDSGKVGRTIGEPVAERTIGFRDEAGGIVSVFDADTQQTLGRFGVGEGAFVRMSVRSMTLKRISKRVSHELPYRLVRTAEGKLSFIDPATGHFIKLNAFGSVAISSFSQFLPDHSEKGA